MAFLLTLVAMQHDDPSDSPWHRWRLILGQAATPPEQSTALSPDQVALDRVLEALYDSESKHGLGASSPNVHRWLGDIRRYFPQSVVQLLQRDALERLQLDRMLLEPELLSALTPDVHLVATLLSLSRVLPDQTRATARQVVAQVVKQVEQQLAYPLQQAVRGSLQRAARTRRPRPGDIDWGQTVRANLAHYQPDYRTVLPIHLRGYARHRRQVRHLILLVDQSGSMASSVVYAGILGCVLASLPSLRTHVVAFDTHVVDLTAHLNDPVDLLFATQLGGGTDINRAVAYAERLVSQPRDTILVLVSDLFEGGDSAQLLQRVHYLVSSGVTFLPLLALSDTGRSAYDHDLATSFARLGLTPFACTPDEFPALLGAALRR